MTPSTHAPDNPNIAGTIRGTIRGTIAGTIPGTIAGTIAGALTLLLAASIGCSVPLAPPIGESSNAAPKPGGTLTLASFVNIRSIDPAIAFDEGSEPVVRLLFARLFQISRDGTIDGDLVDTYRLSPDGLQLTMDLRADAHFHDGSPVLADDVKRSFERAFHPDTPTPVASFFERIDGFSEYRKGNAANLSGISVIAERTFRISLREPDPTLLPLLTLGVTSPVCKSGGHTFDPKFMQSACGAGPYKLASWNGRESIKITRHSSYHNAAAIHLDGITWLFAVPPTSQRFRFERNQLDIVHDLSAADAVAFRSDPRWTPFGSWSRPRATRGVFMNTELPPFNNTKVRQAVAMAIDKHQIASLRAGHLVAANSLIPAGVVGHDPSFQGQQHNLEQALELMSQAGWPFDPSSNTGGYPETIDYHCAADSFDTAVAEVIQQQLRRIGIRIRIKAISWAAYLATTGRRHQAAMGADGWSADYDDPSSFFDPLFSTSAIQQEESQNRSFYSNPELDTLLNQARRETNSEKRRVMYNKADSIIRDDAPWAIIYGFRYYDVHQGYVQGYSAHPHMFLDVARVWLDTKHKTIATRSKNGPPLSITQLAHSLTTRLPQR